MLSTYDPFLKEGGRGERAGDDGAWERRADERQRGQITEQTLRLIHDDSVHNTSQSVQKTQSALDALVEAGSRRLRSQFRQFQNQDSRLFAQYLQRALETTPPLSGGN